MLRLYLQRMYRESRARARYERLFGWKRRKFVQESLTYRALLRSLPLRLDWFYIVATEPGIYYSTAVREVSEAAARRRFLTNNPCARIISVEQGRDAGSGARERGVSPVTG